MKSKSYLNDKLTKGEIQKKSTIKSKTHNWKEMKMKITNYN